MIHNPISTFIRARLSAGDRLCEAFYGIWMVTAVTGMVRASGEPIGESVRLMLFSALGVNITWGIIDGMTNILSGLIDSAEDDELIHSLRTDGDNQKNRQAAMDHLNNTIARYLSEADRLKIIEMIQNGSLIQDTHKKPHGSKLTRDDYERALATFLIDFLMIFPVVLPFLIFNSVSLAMRISHIVATAAFIIIGFTWAKHAQLSRGRTSLAFGLTGIVVIILSYRLGW